ncbi:hypothetical protein ACHAWF_008724 [Thalassiosira exigua]
MKVAASLATLAGGLRHVDGAGAIRGKPTPKRIASEGGKFDAFWYKPHYQCKNATAADFINNEMLGADFIGISEYEVPAFIGQPGYGSVAATSGRYRSPVQLFYKREDWTLIDSVPNSEQCIDKNPFPDNFESFPSPNPGFDCADETNNACCKDTYTQDEPFVCDGRYASAPGLFASDLRSYAYFGSNCITGRPYVMGKLQSKTDPDKEICLIVTELPHSRDKSGEQDPRFPWPKDCTEDEASLEECELNGDETSLIVGTSELVWQTKEFCGSTPIVFMADTNIENPVIGTGEVFIDDSNPLGKLIDYENPYTCCGKDRFSPDTSWAMDRIAVTAGKLEIEKLYGGSSEQGGTPKYPGQNGYICVADEEHAPMRATISFVEPKPSQSCDDQCVGQYPYGCNADLGPEFVEYGCMTDIYGDASCSYLKAGGQYPDEGFCTYKKVSAEE